MPIKLKSPKICFKIKKKTCENSSKYFKISKKRCEKWSKSSKNPKKTGPIKKTDFKSKKP